MKAAPIVLIVGGVTFVAFRRSLGGFKASVDSEWGLRMGSPKLYSVVAVVVGCGMIVAGSAMVAEGVWRR